MTGSNFERPWGLLDLSAARPASAADPAVEMERLARFLEKAVNQ